MLHILWFHVSICADVEQERQTSRRVAGRQRRALDAVNALKAGARDDEDFADDWSPQINTGAAVLIPESYVEDLNIRLSLYRRLSEISTAAERESFAAELIDRFGPLPDETRQLLEVTAIKVQCKVLGISKLDAGQKGAVFAFRGRRGDRLKLLFWDGQGFCLYYKVLERGRFPWPNSGDGAVRLTSAQLARLWEGIDWRRPDWGAPPARVG